VSPKSLDSILTSKVQGIEAHLIRTYLQRVAGKLDSSKFNTKTGQFVASYYAQPGG
jgi:hypothetical protein